MLEKKFKNAEELRGLVERENFELDESKEKLGEVRNKISGLEEVVVSLNKGLTTCPVCESPLSEEKKVSLKAKRETEITKYKVKLEDISELIKKKEVVLKELNETREKFARIWEEIKKHVGEENEFEKLTSSEMEYKERIEEKEAKKKSIESDAKRLSGLHGIKKDEMNLLEMEKELGGVI